MESEITIYPLPQNMTIQFLLFCILLITELLKDVDYVKNDGKSLRYLQVNAVLRNVRPAIPDLT